MRDDSCAMFVAGLGCSAVSVYELPGVVVRLGDFYVPALLDSVSSISLMSQALFNKVPRHDKIKLSPSSFSYFSANTQKMSVSGSFFFKVQIYGFSWKVQFVLASDVLLIFWIYQAWCFIILNVASALDSTLAFFGI